LRTVVGPELRLSLSDQRHSVRKGGAVPTDEIVQYEGAVPKGMVFDRRQCPLDHNGR
jgi:hypothetical protein